MSWESVKLPLWLGSERLGSVAQYREVLAPTSGVSMNHLMLSFPNRSSWRSVPVPPVRIENDWILLPKHSSCYIMYCLSTQPFSLLESSRVKRMLESLERA